MCHACETVTRVGIETIRQGNSSSWCPPSMCLIFVILIQYYIINAPTFNSRHDFQIVLKPKKTPRSLKLNATFLPENRAKPQRMVGPQPSPFFGGRESRVESCRDSRVWNKNCWVSSSRKSDLTSWWFQKINSRTPNFWTTVSHDFLGGGNSNIFCYVHPETWGRWTHFDEHIFFRWVGSTTNQINLIFCKMKDVWMGKSEP